MNRVTKFLSNPAALQRTNTVMTVGLIALTVGTAMAGTDTTFQNITTRLQAWTEGSLGDLFALGTLATGLGIGIVKQTLMPVAVAVGIAAAANWGPAVLTGISGVVL